MHFSVDHTIDIPCEKYFDIALSAEFVAWSNEKFKLANRRIVRSEDVDGIWHHVVRSENHLSERAQRFFKVSTMVVEERILLNRTQRSYTWEYVPNIGSGRFAASGRGRIEPLGSGCRRFIEGEVKVRMLLIGGRIEKRMVEWIKQNIGKAGEQMQEYYRNHWNGR